MRVVVTGGAGFIGSAVIRQIIADTDWCVINLDALTYAGNLDSLAPVAASPRYAFAHLDIRDGAGVRALLAREKPDAILHLAAETHVDRSIDGPGVFVETNVLGTSVLLAAALDYWRGLDQAGRGRFRFQHISTDEVYGALGPQGRFTEDSPYQPNSPYAASKAAADHLVRAWHHTYGLPTVTTNCSNNYGPCQFPEKLIPLVILRALRGESLPVYGAGENVRDWLFVEDHARALVTVLRHGQPGETYAIGGEAERRNIDVVTALCTLLDRLRPAAAGQSYTRLIRFVTDRPGHDARYAIDPGKIRRTLGWAPAVHFEDGLRLTVQWYLDNPHWWERILSGAYRTERLGLGTGQGEGGPSWP